MAYLCTPASLVYTDNQLSLSPCSLPFIRSITTIPSLFSSKKIEFFNAFAKFAYAVLSGSYSAAKSAAFPIDHNSEYPKMVQECTLDVDVTVINENCITQSVSTFYYVES